MDAEHRKLIIVHARGRAVLGLLATLLPGTVHRILLGRPNGPGTAAVRMLGARDLALGLGAVTTVREDGPSAEWVGWGAVADGVDAIALLVTPGLPWRARLGAIVAGASAVFGLRAAQALADERVAS